MKTILRFLKLTLLAASLLVMASCGGGGGGGSATASQPAAATSTGLSVVQVDDATNPIIAVATDNTGMEKLALIGTKDSSGNPLILTQAWYISPSGNAGILTIGSNGLPTSFSDAVGNRVTFANFTSTTMDIALFDPTGNKVVGPVTINVDPTVLTNLSMTAGALVSSRAKARSLQADAFLGISAQDWISTEITAMGTAVGLGGCALVFLAPTPAFPLAALGIASCVSTLVIATQDVLGVKPTFGFSVASNAVSIANDCLTPTIADPTNCLTSVVLGAVRLSVNKLAPPPSVPTNLTVSSINQNQIRFYWTGSTDDVPIDRYSVYRDGSKIADVGGVVYTDLNVLPGVQYYYTVIAQDSNGNSSGASKPLRATIPQTTLFVSSTTPVSDATGVAVNGAVFTTFSGAIDTASLNASTFTVTGPSGMVAGAVSYNAATNSAVFAPSANLAYASTYTANVTVGVKSLTGSSLASDYSWTFTTESFPQPTVKVSVNQTTIGAGGQATLSWSSMNATSCTASGGWSGSQSMSGSTTVSPTATTTYTLACTGAVGTAINSATVTVTSIVTPPTACTAPQTLVNGQCVTLAPATPVISSLSFTSATADSANRTLTIYGSNFAAGDVVQYRWLNPAGSSTSSASVSSTSQLSASFNPGAVNDTIYVKVCQSSSSTACSGEQAIAVSAPAPATPVISSLSSNSINGSCSAQSLTIYGSNFVSGATVNLYDLTNNIPYSNKTTVFNSSGQLTLSANFGGSAANWSLTVVNPGGSSSSSANFSVVGPSITGVSPNPVPRINGQQTITFYGSGFLSGAAVQIDDGTGPYAKTPSVLSSSQLTISAYLTNNPATWKASIRNCPNLGDTWSPWFYF